MKPNGTCRRISCLSVAPRTGAWIETCMAHQNKTKSGSRPPHGGVD